MKLKLFALTLVIAMSQFHNSSGTFLNFMSERFNELAASLVGTLRDVRQHMLKLIKPHVILHVSDLISTTTGYNEFFSQHPLPPDITIRNKFYHSTVITAPPLKSDDIEYSKLMSEPTAIMTTPQMVGLHGRMVESHKVVTKDGYHLVAHRILPKMEKKYSNRTIILHHGLLGSSADWILLGPTKSLPYLLNDKGYDVWLVNARGNYYSREHTWKKIESPSFWKFSWQELGEFDLPAIIDYIHLVKKYNGSCFEKIDYIGHSMGATALLVLLSTSPLYNKYLRVGILLAPMAYMSNVEGPLKNMPPLETNPMPELLKIFGDNEFVPTRQIPKHVALKYCVGPLLFCCNPLYFFAGGFPATDNWNRRFKARVLYHVPAGTSVNTFLHYIQLVKSGKFHKFNDVNYEYNLSKITLPIALISSDEDWLATVPDVLRLYFSIPHPVDHHIIRGKNLSHTEFVWGLEAAELVFYKVLEYLDPVLNLISTKNHVSSNIIL